MDGQEKQMGDHATDAGASTNSTTDLEQYANMFKGENAEAETDDAAEGEDLDGTDEGNDGTLDDDGDDGAVKPDDKDLTKESGDQPANGFEIAKGLSLKVGDKITADHLKQLERGFLREKDYTLKTQELAQIRQQATDILTARDQILQNPQALREFLSDQQILAAYNPHEILVAGLQANKIPPQVWNKFLQDMQESGETPNQNWKADPNAQALGGLQREVVGLKNKLTSFEREKADTIARAKHEEAIRNLDTEVADVLKKIPGLSKREILRELAIDDSNRSVEEIAKAMKAEKDSDRQAYLKNLEEKKKRKLQSPKGTSVPIIPKQPKTFAEADAVLDDMASAGLI